MTNSRKYIFIGNVQEISQTGGEIFERLRMPYSGEDNVFEEPAILASRAENRCEPEAAYDRFRPLTRSTKNLEEYK